MSSQPTHLTGRALRAAASARPRRRLTALFTALAIGLASGVVPGSAAWAAIYASIVVDAENGRVLHQHNADTITYPASLTKMMTLYMLFDALEKGRIGLKDRMPVSVYAAGQSPTKLGIPAGRTLTVEDAIKALVTKSANDAAVVVAEYLGDNEPNFGQMMTRKARQLGMNDTLFRNASGLPNPDQTTTARDMATLSLALRRDFPQFYHYFGVRSFKFGKQTISTHNRVLLNYQGADGLKTGYIRDSGFNLASSARRNGRALVGVVLGGQSASWRDQHMMSLLDSGFAALQDPDRGFSPTAPVMASATDTRSAKQKARDERRERLAAAAEEKRQKQLAAKQAAAEKKLAALEAQKAKATSAADRKALATAKAELAKAERAQALAASQQAVQDQGKSKVQLASAHAQGGGTDWSVQVGAYNAFSNAHSQATRAMQIVRSKVSGAQLMVTPASSPNGLIYRARLTGIDTEQQAKTACALLKKQKLTCLPVPPGAVNVAMVPEGRTKPR